MAESMKYNLIGRKFYKLTAILLVGQNETFQYLWLCQCDCGNKTTITTHNLRAGKIKSCGCLGPRPIGTTLDRIDTNGNYVKDNCRWATSLEQNKNMRSNRYIQGFNRTQHLSAWSRELGINHQTIRACIKRGESIESIAVRFGAIC